MIKAIDPNARIEFVSSSDVGEPKTVFILRPLSGIEMMQFSEGKQDDVFKMLISSIVEVKNFPVEGLSVPEITNSLNLTVLAELIQKVNSLNNLTEQEAKN